MQTWGGTACRLHSSSQSRGGNLSAAGTERNEMRLNARCTLHHASRTYRVQYPPYVPHYRWQEARDMNPQNVKTEVIVLGIDRPLVRSARLSDSLSNFDRRTMSGSPFQGGHASPISSVPPLGAFSTCGVASEERILWTWAGQQMN